nr:MAG TPA: hypothetical protein [Inoviridae sp.]
MGVLHGRPRFHKNDTARRLRQQGAQRKPLPVCFGRARALPLRGRGTRWRRYRVTKRGKLPAKFPKKKNSPDPLRGHGENFFLLRGGLANNLLCIVF